MSKFIISGQKKLSGQITVKGAKNNAQILLAASLLSSQTMKLSNVPNIDGIEKSVELLEDLGSKVKRNNDKIEIDNSSVNKSSLNSKLANKFRTSVMFVGPLLAKFKEVKFPHPGGCVIGASGRPIDLFLEAFAKMGAEIQAKDNYYHIRAKQLKACDFFFPIISVTGTQSLMMTACLAQGTTIIRNAAMEPEVVALANYLKQIGAKISGAGTPTIVVKGVKTLRAGQFKVIPDRIEAGSFAILAAASKSELEIKNCQAKDMLSLLNIFEKIGVNFEINNNSLLVKKSDKIISRDLKTHEYPGFSTDLQSPYIVLMTQAHGKSLIQESIYDRRLVWTDMLSQMGANITACDPHRVVVYGPSKLQAKKLISPDIRAGIALIIAALIAQGTTEIDNIYQIDRGYESLETRLQKIGADIIRQE
jgi:UDP-N-acetylglucosamine 1-carboxyvinyltransferase